MCLTLFYGMVIFVVSLKFAVPGNCNFALHDSLSKLVGFVVPCQLIVFVIIIKVTKIHS